MQYLRNSVFYNVFLKVIIAYENFKWNYNEKFHFIANKYGHYILYL